MSSIHVFGDVWNFLSFARPLMSYTIIQSLYRSKKKFVISECPNVAVSVLFPTHPPSDIGQHF